MIYKHGNHYKRFRSKRGGSFWSKLSRGAETIGKFLEPAAKTVLPIVAKAGTDALIKKIGSGVQHTSASLARTDTPYLTSGAGGPRRVRTGKDSYVFRR